MTNKTSCRSCKYEPIYQGRYFSLQEVIAPMSIADIEAPDFFSSWHKEAAGTPRLRQGDRMKVYQGAGVIADTLDDFQIQAEAEFVVLTSGVNDVRVKRTSDWLVYAPAEAAKVKWNPGKQVHQVLVAGSSVSDHASKDEALLSADEHNKAA